MIPRQLTQFIVSSIKPEFITVIYGPRRIGKTILLQQIQDKLGIAPGETLQFNGDTQESRDTLSTTSEVVLSRLVKDRKLIIVDEAQRIDNIGLTLKILIDTHPELIILVTGSSSLQLARGMHETLTGRTQTYHVYPLSTQEVTTGLADYKKHALLEEQLIFGGYPYVHTLSVPNEKIRYLNSIVEDYLFQDVLTLEKIQNPSTLRKLATLLAFQIGSEVSYNELSRTLGIDVKTVIRYISLLVKCFVIVEVGAYGNNLRQEVSTNKKYYFWDLGIRNALISQFYSLNSRTDTGALWENFLALERIKKNEYTGLMKQYYFWRTYQGSEVDFIEADHTGISAFEFKFSRQKTATSRLFKSTYNVDIQVVTKDSYLDFV